MEVSKVIQKSVDKGVKITIKNFGGINRLQILQNLVDNMRQRLLRDHGKSSVLEDQKIKEIPKDNCIYYIRIFFK